MWGGGGTRSCRGILWGMQSHASTIEWKGTCARLLISDNKNLPRNGVLVLNLHL